MKSIGADAVINTSDGTFAEEIKNLCPEGINICYESVGGELLDSIIDNIAIRGKCVSIGFIANYAERGLGLCILFLS